MTNILDLSAEYKKRDAKKGGISLAEQNFLSNISSLQGIKASPGYILIKGFWERELQDSLSQIRDIDSSKANDVARLQAKLDLSQRFLGYLNGYEGV